MSLVPLNAAGAILREHTSCRCREEPEPHFHRWQIVCEVCGFEQPVESARSYELVAHLVVDRDGDVDDLDVQLRLGDEPAICMGSGFRATARLTVCVAPWLTLQAPAVPVFVR